MAKAMFNVPRVTMNGGKLHPRDQATVERAERGADADSEQDRRYGLTPFTTASGS